MKRFQNALFQSLPVQKTMRSYVPGQGDPAEGLYRQDLAWFVVFVAVLLALAAAIFTAMAIWCMTNGHGSFSGSWNWHDMFAMNIQCSW